MSDTRSCVWTSPGAAGYPRREDPCVTRLQDKLVGRPGIEEAHVTGVKEGKPQLCVHYDPNVISLSRLRELVSSTGLELTDRFAHVLARVNLPMMPGFAQRIAEQLRSLEGVIEADVSPGGVVRIEYDRRGWMRRSPVNG
jgi:Cd2+/Zn2+-exporting ATPase